MTSGGHSPTWQLHRGKQTYFLSVYFISMGSCCLPDFEQFFSLASPFPQATLCWGKFFLASKISWINEDLGPRLNASKYCSNNKFSIGETVLLRNYIRTSRFDPFFSPEKCEIIQVSNNGWVITVQRKVDGKTFKRHPDDLKRCVSSQEHEYVTGGSEWETLNEWNEIPRGGNQYFEEDIGEKKVVGEDSVSTESLDEGELQSIDNATHAVLRHPARERRLNPRYYNDNVQHIEY